MAAAVSRETATNSFWSAFDAMDTPPIDPKAPLVIRGREFPPAGELQQHMFASCTMVEKLAKKYFESPPSFVIDLGCGNGANSLPMHLSGAKVHGIDSSILQIAPYALATYPPEARKDMLTLTAGDITTMPSYGKDADLVLAVDVLPYIQPSTMKSTMEKIHAALKDGGLLIGTLFIDLDGTPQREMLEGLGAHFYSGGATFVTAFLSNAGFEPKAIEERDEGGYRFEAVKLTA